jgi:hypothetical protein
MAFLKKELLFASPWCGCSDGECVSSVGREEMLMISSCAGGLTVETTSWEPLRQAEELKEKQASTQ